MRVLLVSMPFANLRWGSLALGLLKSALQERGVGCDVAYLNFDLAERIGLELYHWIADSFAFVLGGERLFARELFGSQLPDDDRYWQEVLSAADPRLSHQEREDYLRVAEEVRPFLDDCARAIDWSRYAVVGFTVSFQQTLASLCLADRIKRVCPATKVLFGGAACQGPMGVALLRQFPQLDYVFLGEADAALPMLVAQLAQGRVGRLPPGVAGKENMAYFRRVASSSGTSISENRTDRDDTAAVGTGAPVDDFRPCFNAAISGGATSAWVGACSVSGSAASAGAAQSGPCVTGREQQTAQVQQPESAPELSVPDGASDNPAIVTDLDLLPYPNFDDYFARLQRSPLREHIEPMLFFETSRGCWWGQKHQCAFCGLNGPQLHFRSKSAGRALAELEHLVRRYGVRKANSADNVLDIRYLDTLMPRLADSGLALEFVYELKTNLTRRQVEQLVRAGLRAAQLGVETFSTLILRQIRKGATAAQNIQALKWFTAAGVEVKWNLLYGFPGEDPQQYAALAQLLPLLYHLAPPVAIGRVRVDRFSPYFRDPARYGITNVRPHKAFRFVYPFTEQVLWDLAYYFEYDYHDRRDPLSYAGPLIAAAETWQQLAGTVALHGFDRSDGVLLVTDTRPVAQQFQWRLAGADRAVYLFCDTARSWQSICRFVAELPPSDRLGQQQLEQLLDRWITGGIMLHIDDRFLSLATLAPSPQDECRT